MDFLWDKITEWLKEMLIGGIVSNLSGMFDATNQKVAEISGQVGLSPQAWNGSIFSMIQNLSETVIVPIAGAILAFVMTLELIQLITDKNNLNDMDTWIFFKWAFKSAAAVLIVTNTWTIVMGVFDAAQSVVASASGLIIGDTSINISSVMVGIEDRLMEMELGPLFGLLSTMIVTGKMSFFSDALGHSGFTGIAIGVLCGAVQPIYFAVGLSVLFALLFSFVRSRTSQSADTIIGVFSSTAVALGIFIVTLGGRSFTKFNRYLIGDILSVSPQEIGLLALVLLAVVLLWVFGSNRLVLTAVHPQLASSRGVATKRNETLFTVAIAIVVTLAMSWVGLMVINSLLVLPAAASRNLARNLRQYHLLSVLSALVCGLLGLCAAYWLGCSAGATIALLLAVYFAVSFALRNRAA